MTTSRQKKLEESQFRRKAIRELNLLNTNVLIEIILETVPDDRLSALIVALNASRTLK